MRKLIYYVGASLDGYIAGPGGEFGFFPLSPDMATWITERYPETIPTHLRRDAGVEGRSNSTFDTLVMGRGTYEPALTVPTTSPYAHLRQYVVSSTLSIDDDTVTVVPDDPIGLVRRLKAEESDKHIWLCGGGRLAGSLMAEIDELIIKSYPVLSGGGIALVDGPFDPTLFTPTRRETFDNGAVVSWFSRS
ncbi:dihydrofolate reductase family protein [Microlunatus soli]|uniref:Dihydrofolate reductase n=1 Tax=Microlunatus soli TaxID=630515 RepID=A0A1H1U6P4_9ACTN|nr:dihydrofolate reductase family protein [Microlunatus soli]SDS68031.1 Dihydrofolate reductase [Microlunatus soli]